MSLLKEKAKSGQPPKHQAFPTKEPTELKVNLTFGSGLKFGSGLGVAFAIIVPVIVFLTVCMLGTIGATFISTFIAALSG